MSKTEMKLIVLDVDGVLTDGKLLIGSNGVEFKSFHVKDGMGISLAKKLGIKIAIISGRESESVRIRAKELGIDFLFEGITDKLKILRCLVKSLDIRLDQVFYMGDDLNDLPVIREVGFSAAPNDAVEIVKKYVDFVSPFNGGNGAVRDAIEFILSRHADYSQFINEFVCKAH